MKKTVLISAIAGAAAAAAVATAGTAAAIPPSGSAADVVRTLQDQGYSVQFNGTVLGPLAKCSVTGVHGLVVMMMPDGSLMMSMDESNPGDVFVDVSCPSSNN
ncbi:hypothetical protein [Mycobacterium sp. M26]|uniref:hypothetical protein n=1 Tax=Mycobacterium sp. M26 TaxID=1762962 RepID=UPI00073E2241|nr:hypothetical protein [Mycobacterium sp. M26]